MNCRSRHGTHPPAILSVMTAFGKNFRPLSEHPTADGAQLLKDLEKAEIDESAKANICSALMAAIQHFGPMARRDGRKLMLVVVANQAGEDGDGPLLERCLELARRHEARIDFIGREASFGSFFRHVPWRHPYTGAMHFLPIRRGPESAFIELLQHDGFGKRVDFQMSGYAPYALSRLAHETGGKYFIVPDQAIDEREFEARNRNRLERWGYVPSLDSRGDYEKLVIASPFRRAVWDAIQLLNPYTYDKDFVLVENPELNLPIGSWYHVAQATRRDGDPNVDDDLRKVTSLLELVDRARRRLQDVEHLRDQEESPRWRANHDLMSAQLAAYRVRLLQFGIALTQFRKHLDALIRDANERHSATGDVLRYEIDIPGIVAAGKKTFTRDEPMNRWRVEHGLEKLLIPNDEERKLFRIIPEELEQAHRNARERLAGVARQHPDTAYAKRAEWELSRNFGVGFETRYIRPPGTPRPPVRILRFE